MNRTDTTFYPTHYTSVEGGELRPWPTKYGALDTLDLHNAYISNNTPSNSAPWKGTVCINTLRGHDMHFHSLHGISGERWDCINGWTDLGI